MASFRLYAAFLLSREPARKTKQSQFLSAATGCLPTQTGGPAGFRPANRRATALKVELQRELNHSRCVQRGCDLPARGTVNGARWIAERWMVQDIEELAAEFHALGFSEGERLHYREVDLLQDVTAQDVAASRAVAKARRR